MKRVKKEMEYEDAPSGFVTLYNYKEPFMKFEGGFGYEGVLLFDGSTDTVQCHLCGGWYGILANHIAKEHAMRVAEYKDTVGLSQTTALISETVRAKLIASGLDKRLQNLRQNSKNRDYTVTEETKDKIRQTLKRNTAEYKNIRGTCPLQLISRLKAKYEELGRTPSERDKGVPYEAIVKTYGSYKEACRIANIPYREPGKTISGITKRWTEERAISFVKNFLEGNGKLPNSKDAPGLWSCFRKKIFNRTEIFKKSVMECDEYKGDLDMRYTKDELLQLLRKFEKINARRPSYSDCKRRLLPHLSRYSYHFGSWKNALKLAFD